jgi:hypothetical protein
MGKDTVVAVRIPLRTAVKVKMSLRPPPVDVPVVSEVLLTRPADRGNL